MDYRTKITTYASVLVALTLTAILGLVFSGQAVTERQIAQPLFDGLQADTITTLNIENQATLAKRDDGTWQVMVGNKAYPALAERVTSYVQTLGQLKKERLVSSENDLATYGLDKDFKRLQARDKGGKVLFDLQIGKPDPRGTAVFVKFEDKKEIWQTDRGFARSLDQDFNTWTDLSLVRGNLKPEDLIRVSFAGTLTTKENKVFGPFELVKQIKDKKAQWQLKSDGTFPERAEGFINQLPLFKANSYLKPEESFDPTKVIGTLILDWSKGNKTELKLGPPDSQGRFPVAEGDRLLWVNDWALDSILYGGIQRPTPAPPAKK